MGTSLIFFVRSLLIRMSDSLIMNAMLTKDELVTTGDFFSLCDFMKMAAASTVPF